MLTMLLTTALAAGPIVYSTSVSDDSPMRAHQDNPGQNLAVVEMLQVFIEPPTVPTSPVSSGSPAENPTPEPIENPPPDIPESPPPSPAATPAPPSLSPRPTQSPTPTPTPPATPPQEAVPPPSPPVQIQNQAPLTINNPGEKTYGDSPFILSTNGGSGTGTVTFKSSNTSVLSVAHDTGMVIIEGAGTATITATKAGDENYHEITATRSITVGLRDIEHAAVTIISTHAYDGLVQMPDIIVTDGPSNLITSDDYEVSFGGDRINAGTTGSVTITPAPGGNYYGGEVTVYFTISPRALIVDFTADNKEYDGGTSAAILTSTLRGVLPVDDGNVILDDSAVAVFSDKNVNVNKTVTASGFTLSGAGAGNYTIGTINRATADITARQITVTGITAADRVFDNTRLVTLFGGLVENTVIGDSVGFALHGGTMINADAGSDKVVTPNTVTLTGADAGNYTLTQPDYLITVNITPRAITITPNTGQSKVYGAADPALTFTATPSLLGSDTFTGSLSRTAGEDFGTYAINIGSLSASSNYTLTFSSGATFAITLASGTFIEPGAIDTTYTPTLTLGDLSPQLPAGFVWSAAGTALSGGSAQRFPAIFTCPSGNYMPVNGYITVNVARADQSALTINTPGTKTYGDSGFTLTTTGGTTGGTVTFERISGNSLSVSSIGYAGIDRAGDTVVRATMAGNGNYNEVTSAELTITVGKRDLSSISIGSITGLIYTGLPQNPIPAVTDNPSAGNLIASGDWEIDTSWESSGYKNNINVGEATLRLRATAAGNYTGTADSTFLISKATLTVTADDKEKEFEGVTPAFTYTITDFVNGETETVVTGEPTITTTYNQGYPRGNYDIIITRGTLDADNYDFYFYNGTLTVGVAAQAPLTLVTSDSQTTYVYGTTGITLEVGGGTTNGEVTYSVPYGHNVVDVSSTGELIILSAGEATVRARMAGNEDFSAVYANLNLTISPKPLTEAMININSVTYNGSAQTPTITVTDGIQSLIHSSDYSWTFVPQTTANESGYDVTIEGKGNYGGSVTVQFAINRVALTITADDKTMTFGGSLPAFTARYTGFVDADSPSTYDFGGLLSFDTDYTAVSVGNYYIRPSGQTSPNYDITYEDGVLTVNKAAGSFGTPSAIGTAYAPTLTLDNLDLPAGYVWNEPSTILSIGAGQTFAATFTDPSGNFEPAYGYITVNVAKVPGIATTDEITVTYSPSLTVSDAVEEHISSGYSFADAGVSLTVADSPKIVTGYKDNADPSNYEQDSVTVTITIDPMSIADAAVSIAETSFIYNGSAFTPPVYVTPAGSSTELNAADYDITYTNNTGAGTATVTVTGKDNYTGTASNTFTIAKANQPAVGVTGIPAIVTYGDDPITLGISGGAGTGNVTYQITSGNAILTGSQLTVTGAGSITLTAEKAGDANHNVSNTVTLTFTAERKLLTWNTGATVNNRVYNRSTTATVLNAPTLAGVIGSDLVTVTTGTAAFADMNVGTDIAVTGSGWGIGGTGAVNYTAPTTQPVFEAANITPLQLTWSTGATVNNKVYNRSVDATVLNAPTLVGVISGDTVTVTTGTAAFADANAANGKAVTASGWGIVSNSNYTAPAAQPVFAAANITAAPLTISGVTTTARNYNGQNTVALSGGTLSGVLSGDTVGFTLGNGTMANATVGTGKAVTTNITLSGAQAGNYTLTQPTGITITINRATLTPSISFTGVTASRVYNRSTAISGTQPTITLTGAAAGESPTATATFAFTNWDVGTNKQVNASSIALTGTWGTNYQLSATSLSNIASTMSITRAQLTWTANSGRVSDKQYDGNNVATVTTNPTLSGVISGDTVTVTAGTAVFNNANVATGKTVTGSGTWGIGGASVTNYTAPTAQPTFATAAITTRTLTATIGAVSRTLSPLTGETTATFNVTITGLIGTDSLTVSWAAWTGVTLSNNTGIVNNTARAITITYDGTSTITTPTNSRTLTINNSNYTLSTSTVSVPIRDGRAVDRAIPVNNTNFQNFGTYARTTNGRSRHYFLTQNVTLSGTNNWTPIGNFSGSFNGNGYTISGMNMNIPGVDSSAGMFSYIGSGGSVRNLGLTNVNIQGGEIVGGIVADMGTGTIENCWVTGTVTAREYYVGGIVGHTNGSTIRNCYTTASVTGRRTYSEVGGIAGRLYGISSAIGLIENCYASGNISGSTSGGIVGNSMGTTTIRNSVAINGTITGDTSSRNRVTGSASGSTTLTNNHARNGLEPVANVGANLRGGATMAAATTHNTSAFWSGLGWSATIWNLTANAPPTLRAPSPLASSAPIDFTDIIFIEEEEEPDDLALFTGDQFGHPSEGGSAEPGDLSEDESDEDEPEEDELEDKPEEDEPEEDEPEVKLDAEIDESLHADVQTFNSLEASAYSHTDADNHTNNRSFTEWWQLLLFPTVWSIGIFIIRSKGALRR